ncbi:peptidoglycan-recognition protein SB2-like isoform X2 [Periplaneta americana]|uniref:peptidoglycan-recognition protein SB2-like isoform X2 n=1 Tax=Periplaneta americana TaxID=6978 RepID=UPI0037E822C0
MVGNTRPGGESTSRDNEDRTGPTGSSPSSPFQLVNRSSWGALPPKDKTPLPHPPATLVVIIHTDSTPCDTLDTCSEAVREIQRAHLKKYSDIAFNFLVGGDGRVYEGRGWDLQGAFARSFNNVSLGVAFIGKFSNVAPPNQQLEEAQALIDVSLKNNKLPSDYKLVGHRQVTDTDSPGDALFNIIKTWPHWKDCYMSTCRPAKSRTSDFIH